MTDASPLFVDTNILVYASVEESPFHLPALHALSDAYQGGRALWISRQVIREYIAAMTRPDMLGASGVGRAVSQVKQILNRFLVADEVIAVTDLLTLLETHQVSGKQVHDANIVATMQAYGIRYLLTANVADFERFGAIIDIEALAPGGAVL